MRSKRCLFAVTGPLTALGALKNAPNFRRDAVQASFRSRLFAATEIICSADLLTIETVPSGSTPIMPADTPSSTASENRRRSSIWSLAERISLRCVFSSEIILLNVPDSDATSPSERRTGTSTSRLPCATSSAAPMSSRIGRTSRSATAMPVQIAESSTTSVKSEIEQRKGNLRDRAVGFKAVILGSVGLDDLHAL